MGRGVVTEMQSNMGKQYTCMVNVNRWCWEWGVVSNAGNGVWLHMCFTYGVCGH